MPSASDWMETDETAKQYLSRLLTDRPFAHLPPPLHRIPLRAGNVVEIVGPSPSAKTQILIQERLLVLVHNIFVCIYLCEYCISTSGRRILKGSIGFQASISCILPKEWKGVHYGGLGRPVVFIDLDCRFDILIFSSSLKQHILEAKGKSIPSIKGAAANMYDNDLVAESMRKFMYIRCYDSIQFLATLKTMHNQLQKGKEAHGIGAYLMIIDSIGAFYWMDRALAFMPRDRGNRKCFSLQGVSETVVQEIKKILLAHPMVVLSTKTVSIEDKYTSNEIVRNVGKCYGQNSLDDLSAKSRCPILSYREYMPLAWQSFVSHRILVCPSGVHKIFGS
ncbi:unnamed protein product [Cuscuta campestris]|uniref:RecA family profile 1 domain-containing protein n=1 Tax=Cuscuta campestris TaxID=132261 RepID=A0A484KXM0_9ASTE|nr:unnamed protein product [Cuscuta campestris]